MLNEKVSKMEIMASVEGLVQATKAGYVGLFEFELCFAEDLYYGAKYCRSDLAYIQAA
jgi:hypothetical protein